MLLAATIILAGAAWQRGAEYDEGYTVFLANGTPRPAWPTGPFRAGEMRAAFGDAGTPAGIAAALRTTDVHPPLYFWSAWAWRRAVGDGLFALRLFSVACALVSLLLVRALARAARIPPLPAMLVTLGCYGFAYTGQDARGFALAQVLGLAGTLLVLRAGERGGAGRAAWGGLLLGLATFSNYLAAFGGAASLLWLFGRRLRRPWLWLAGGVGFLLLIPADLWFFLAQRGSRVGQFPPFALAPAVARLARYAAGNVFGGLPLYATGTARSVLGAALAALLAACVLLIAVRWRRIGTTPSRWLFALNVAAPPLGLIALGVVFNNTPIELRYLSFADPFFALLLAGALASLRRPAALTVGGVVLAVQAAALVGLIFAPETMQPQARATREAAALAGPDGLVLIPYGNDGVGVVGAVLQSAPDRLRLLVVRQGQTAAEITGAAGRAPRIVVADIGVDNDSRATLAALDTALAASPCWRETAASDLATAYASTGACGPTAALAQEPPQEPR